MHIVLVKFTEKKLKGRRFLNLIENEMRGRTENRFVVGNEVPVQTAIRSAFQKSCALTLVG